MPLPSSVARSHSPQWDLNNNGQIGVGDTTLCYTCIAMWSLIPIACAIDPSNRRTCWGYRADKTIKTQLTPVETPSFPPTQISSRRLPAIGSVLDWPAPTQCNAEAPTAAARWVWEPARPRTTRRSCPPSRWLRNHCSSGP